MQDERRLVRRIQQGDRQAFAEFLDAYGPRVHRLVRRYIANPSDAEDVTQEIFCDIYRSIGKFRGEAALSTWIYRIAVNRCLRHCQRQREESLPYEDERVQALEDNRHDPMQAAVRGELSTQVQAALQQLSPLHYDVVLLCEMHGLTYQECATALDIPVGTVKSRLSNAFRRLRESLRGYVQGENSGVLCAEPLQERVR